MSGANRELLPFNRIGFLVQRQARPSRCVWRCVRWGYNLARV